MATDALTEAERVNIRHHMGYIQVGELYTFVLGTPASLETTFVIEGAMDRVLVAALPKVRYILSVLDQIEAQEETDLELLAVEALGDIKVNQDEFPKLDRRYDVWVGKLANSLGVPRNPFDKRLMVGGCNRAVAG